MPLPGARYRMTKNHMRLAFNKNNKVIEAKNMKTGAIHTDGEFAEDKANAGHPDDAIHEEIQHGLHRAKGQRQGPKSHL